MNGIFRTLFGGSEQKSQSGPVQVAPAPFADLRGPVSSQLTNLLSGNAANPLAGIPAFGQPLAAPITANETALLGALQDLRGGVGSDTLRRTAAGEFVDPATNPFLRSFIEASQRPTLQGLEETISRVLPGRFTAAGQFVQPQGSSAFDRAAALATRGAAQTLGDIATNIGFGAFEAERGRQQQAIQLGQQEVQTVVNNLQAQALPRLIQQLGIDRGVEEFRTRLNALVQLISTAGQLGAQQPVFGTQSTSEGSSTTGVVPALGSFFSGFSRLPFVTAAPAEAGGRT